MTCIAGLVDQGKVYMGGDSACVEGYDLTVRSGPKVFRNGEYLIGYTTSFRMGQLLQYSFSPPHPFDRKGEDLMRFIVVDFVSAMRDCLKWGGFTKIESSQEIGGRLLLGCRGRLFLIDSDFHVGEPVYGYDAVGIGASVARGALFATPGNPDPVGRILMALTAAERWGAGVRGPFHVLATGEE